jgi:hypothetical protein
MSPLTALTCCAKYMISFIILNKCPIRYKEHNEAVKILTVNTSSSNNFHTGNQQFDHLLMDQLKTKPIIKKTWSFSTYLSVMLKVPGPSKHFYWRFCSFSINNFFCGRLRLHSAWWVYFNWLDITPEGLVWTRLNFGNKYRDLLMQLYLITLVVLVHKEISEIYVDN